MPNVDLAIAPSLGIRGWEVFFVGFIDINQPIVVVVVVLGEIGLDHLAQDDAGIAGAGCGLTIEGCGGGEKVVSGCRDFPRKIPCFHPVTGGDGDALAEAIAVRVGEQLGRIPRVIAIGIREKLCSSIAEAIVVDIRKCLGAVPEAIVVTVHECFCRIPGIVAI